MRSAAASRSHAWYQAFNGSGDKTAASRQKTVRGGGRMPGIGPEGINGREHRRHGDGHE